MSSRSDRSLWKSLSSMSCIRGLAVAVPPQRETKMFGRPVKSRLAVDRRRGLVQLHCAGTSLTVNCGYTCWSRHVRVAWGDTVKRLLIVGVALAGLSAVDADLNVFTSSAEAAEMETRPIARRAPRV